MADFYSIKCDVFANPFSEEEGHVDFESNMYFDNECINKFMSEDIGESSGANRKAHSANGIVKKKRIRKSRNPAKHADPTEASKWRFKYVKSDLLTRQIRFDRRKDYMTMFINASNSHDFGQYFNYMATYCSKDLLEFQTVDVCNELSDVYSSYSVPKLSQTIGIQNAAQQVYNYMQMMPDMVSTLSSVKIHSYSNGCSKIVGNMYFVTSMLYDLSYMATIPPNFLVTHENNDTELVTDSFVAMASGTNNEQDKFEFVTPEGLVVNTRIHSLLDRSPMLRVPLIVETMGEITMLLDKDRRIERIYFNFAIVSSGNRKAE